MSRFHNLISYSVVIVQGCFMSELGAKIVSGLAAKMFTVSRKVTEKLMEDAKGYKTSKVTTRRKQWKVKWKWKSLIRVQLFMCDPIDCSLPGSSVHGILQVRIPEWVAIPFSRGSSQPRDWTHDSHTAGKFFTVWATWDVQEYWSE